MKLLPKYYSRKETQYFVKCDVGEGEYIRQAVDKTFEKWGRIDFLVDNAAMITFKLYYY